MLVTAAVFRALPEGEVSGTQGGKFDVLFYIEHSDDYRCYFLTVYNGIRPF